MTHRSNVLSSIAIIVATTGSAHAETLTFRAGDANGGTTDTWLRESLPNNDNSGSTVLDWDANSAGGENHALVRFDEVFGPGAGQIEAADQITSATLEYFASNEGSQGTVNEVLVDWTNGVTWNTFGGDPGVQSDEYGAKIGDAVGLSGARSVNVRSSSIVAWAQDPASNRGWIIRPTAIDGTQITSSEGLAARRVKLTVVINEGEPPAVSVIRGPYLQLGTPTSGVVRWRTDVPTDSRVLYGDAPDALDTAVIDKTLTTDHAVPLSGLAPETTYFYAVGTSSEVLAGADPDHFFVTAPPANAERPTRIWVVGDSGFGNAGASAVYDAYRDATGSEYTDVFLMLGDNAYLDGTEAEYQVAMFDIYPELLRQTFVWSTFGNHDGHSADSSTESGPYYDIFTLPRKGEAGGVASGTEAYYSFDYGRIHFVCLDSYETDTAVDGEMMTWLVDDLANTLADWIIAFWHHPPYTRGSHNSDTESDHIDMRERAVPILEAAGVDLVLGGHSHSYERSFLLNGHYGVSSTLEPEMLIDDGDGREDGTGAYDKGEGGPNTGAVYMVMGSSARLGGGLLNHPAMFASFNQLGSVVLEIDGGRLDATFLRSTGTVGDYFTMLKDGSCPGDLNDNGAVEFGDLLAILGAWGNAGGPEDLDGSGTVDFGDLLIVLGSWGPCVERGLPLTLRATDWKR